MSKLIWPPAIIRNIPLLRGRKSNGTGKERLLNPPKRFRFMAPLKVGHAFIVTERSDQQAAYLAARTMGIKITSEKMDGAVLIQRIG